MRIAYTPRGRRAAPLHVPAQPRLPRHMAAVSSEIQPQEPVVPQAVPQDVRRTCSLHCPGQCPPLSLRCAAPPPGHGSGPLDAVPLLPKKQASGKQIWQQFQDRMTAGDWEYVPLPAYMHARCSQRFVLLQVSSATVHPPVAGRDGWNCHRRAQWDSMALCVLCSISLASQPSVSGTSSMMHAAPAGLMQT
jgi:hypothetical protein